VGGGGRVFNQTADRRRLAPVGSFLEIIGLRLPAIRQSKNLPSSGQNGQRPERIIMTVMV
jgi:hypothetical protein